MPAVETESAAPKPEKRSLRVLLTGFGPFRDVKENPSWLAVSKLNGQTLNFTIPPGAPPRGPKPPPVQVQVHITALLIPTTYAAVLNIVPPLYMSKQYDVMIHIGVGRPGGFAVEPVAHKFGYLKPDADGQMCDPVSDAKGHATRGFGKGFEKFGEEIRTGVDVDGIVKHLRELGFKNTNPSSDPGRYLCDFIYYCSLACAQTDGEGVKTLFMHVPPTGSPYNIEEMTRAVKGLVEYFAFHT